jgi:CheY-like chemotaxis protein
MLWLENCRNVLVADDDKETRLYLRALMQSWGCRVSEAKDGQAAIEMVHEKCPDLVLLDLNMPRLDGLAVAEKTRQIKGKCEQVPIIAITGYDTHGMRDAALAAGCSDYLGKPIDQDEFEHVLRRLFHLSFETRGDA